MTKHIQRFGSSQQGWVTVLVGFIVTIGILLVCGLFIASTIHSEPKSTGIDNPVSNNMKGVSISPPNYDADGLMKFFKSVQQLDGIVTWAGDWAELNTPQTGASMLVNNSTTYSYTPIAQVTAFKDAGQAKVIPIRELTDQQIDAYVESARIFASTHQPHYLGLGIEVNRIYESSPSDYQRYLSLFNEAADAVHGASPSTKVFVSFQLERLRGLRGGLYGGTNDTSQSNWERIEDFAKADGIAFTTYPSLIYPSPSEIPADYYSSIAQHIPGQFVAFSESGWPAETTITGWESSDEYQIEFVNRIQSEKNNLDADFIIWSFLFDQDVPQPFASMGLIDSTGNRRRAYEVFVSM